MINLCQSHRAPGSSIQVLSLVKPSGLLAQTWVFVLETQGLKTHCASGFHESGDPPTEPKRRYDWSPNRGEHHGPQSSNSIESGNDFRSSGWPPHHIGVAGQDGTKHSEIWLLECKNDRVLRGWGQRVWVKPRWNHSILSDHGPAPKRRLQRSTMQGLFAQLSSPFFESLLVSFYSRKKTQGSTPRDPSTFSPGTTGPDVLAPTCLSVEHIT